MISQPKVVILILNYQKWTDTIKCIQSLLKCGYTNFQILVIDNASSNESVSILTKTYPFIPIYTTDNNLGYTGGINFGMVKATEYEPEYILVLNPDTIATPDFLNHLVEGMELCPSSAAACGTIYHMQPKTKLWYAGGKLIPWRGLAVHFKSIPSLSADEKFKRVTFVTGCMMLLRASTLPIIGNQDERFFLYLDDIEYSARMISKGFDLIYVPESVIYHNWIGLEDSNYKLYYSVRNRLLLIEKSFKGLPAIIARIYFIIVIALKLIIWSVLKPTFFTTALSGLKDYYNGRFGKGNFGKVNF